MACIPLISYVNIRASARPTQESLRFLLFALLLGLLNVGHHAATALYLTVCELVTTPRVRVIARSQLNAYGCAR